MYYVVAKFFCRTNYYHATKLKAGKGKPALPNTEDCMPWLKFKGLESNNQVSLNTNYVQNNILICYIISLHSRISFLHKAYSSCLYSIYVIVCL